MRLAKRTYSLPPDLALRFESTVPPGDRSGFLAKLIEDWLAEKERQELRRLVIEGCHEMAAVNVELDREWNGAADEVWRACE